MSPTTLGLFDVVVASTPAAIKCQLDVSKPDRYRLQFVNNGIILKERENSGQHSVWRQLHFLRFDYIRRYGKRTNVFIIEAGRSCETGEGEFRFQSSEAEKMFNLFRSTTEDILVRQHGGSERGIDLRSSIRKSKSEENSELNAPEEEYNTALPTIPQKSPTLETKGDDHVYSQVQKKRVAPDIPPRGSIRRPSGNNLQDSNRSLGPLSTVPPIPSVFNESGSNNSKNEKREPIYAELVQAIGAKPSKSSYAGGSPNKMKSNITKTRCRSPAPITDNFIKLDGYTQYATVVDFLPPDASKSAQEKLIASASESSSQVNMQTANVNYLINMADIRRSIQVDPPQTSPRPNEKNVKSKSKDSKKKGPNDENKHSSWLSFFSSRKTTSS